MAEGQIVAKKVTGKVSVLLNGVTADLHDDQRVSQHATIVTGNGSSVILVFSNGATTQLGADTSLSIDEFMQDPFSENVNVSDLTAEPTSSHTKLHLNKGELLGKVAHLNLQRGSYFQVETPVGAAGIRGTIFRIVFRPTGTGQAFAVFSLSTLEGNVHFQQQGPGGQGTPPPGGPGQPPAPGGQGGPPQGGQPQGSGGSSGGVPVVTGQEVVVTVEVNVNAQGVATVTAPPVITSTQEIPAATKAVIAQQAQAVATAAATVTFPAVTSGGTSTSGTSTTSDSTKSDKKDDSDSGDSKKSDGTTSGADSSNGTSSAGTSSSSSSTAGTSTSTGSTSGPTESSTTSAAATLTGSTNTTGSLSTVNNVVPPPTTPLPQLTPLAGQ